MPKKRKTRVEKIRTQLRQSEQTQAPTFEFVKREFNSIVPRTSVLNLQVKSKESSIQNDILASTKKDLAKTFTLASVILVVELVLYLAWK